MRNSSRLTSKPQFACEAAYHKWSAKIFILALLLLSEWQQDVPSIIHPWS